MISQPRALLALQKIDLQLIQGRKRLQEINHALQDNDMVTAAQAQVEDAQQVLAPLKTTVRALEHESQATTQKAKASEDRLYGGKVRNPKELQDLQHEIESLKRRSEDLENQLLETLITVEDSESHLALCEEALQAATHTLAQQHAALREEQEQLAAGVEALKQQRKQAAENVTPENQQLYDMLKSRKANQAVAEMHESTCAICGIEQTSADAQEIRRGNLLMCQNCGRILVAVQ